MKKLVFALAAVALAAWVVTWFRAPEAVATSAARPWPAGMGPLQSADGRAAATHANDASRRFLALANALPNDEAVGGYVRREIARGELAIGRAPALADVAPLRDLLLREPLTWERREGIGGGGEDSAMRTAQMTAARALLASALAKGRAKDAAAWDDLRAVWNLARSLDGQPQMMTQTASFTMARMLNAIAWKMSLPAPPWFRDVTDRDAVRPLLESFQFQTAAYWHDGAKVFPTKWLADSIEHDRAIAAELARTTNCDVTVRANELGTDLTSVWRRAFRYRAEREATANALRMRASQPIETKSVCSDGAWTLEGSTLRFTRDIAPPANDQPMPLVLRVVP